MGTEIGTEPLTAEDDLTPTTAAGQAFVQHPPAWMGTFYPVDGRRTDLAVAVRLIEREAAARSSTPLDDGLVTVIENLPGACHDRSGLGCDASPCVENVSRQAVLDAIVRFEVDAVRAARYAASVYDPRTGLGHATGGNIGVPTPLDDGGLDELRALSEAATGGPWFAQGSLLHGPDKGSLDIGELRAEVYDENDTRFIVAAVNYVRRVLAETLRNRE